MTDHIAVGETKEDAIQKALVTHENREYKRIQEHIRRRMRLQLKCKGNPERQAIARGACKSDPVKFINDWVWTYNEWNAGERLPTKLPLVLRPKQVDLIEWLEELLSDRENGLIEKSRKEGATYVCLAFGLHHWLFVPGFSMACGSRKLELVDEKGNLDALIPKFRYMLYNLPGWMIPDDFSADRHDNFARILNPKTEARITGEAGENMGRGGRSTLYLVDEWAFVQQQDAVNAAISDNAKVHVKVSTPSGGRDKMQTEKFSGRYRVFTMHWKDNPTKNFQAGVMTDDGLETIYPWYEVEKRKKDPSTLAREVDIDYGAAAENVVIPGKWVRAAVDADLPKGDVRQAGLDVGGSSDHTIYTERRGPVVTRIQKIGSGEAQQANDVENICRQSGVRALVYDRMGVGSGITATLKARESELPFEVIGITNSDRPTGRKFRDRPEVAADERFKDYAAELWWALRLRFKATYEAMQGIEDHSPTDCISIPNRASLINQLTQPTYSKTGTDKIKVDKFGLGSDSPDEAESLMYSFATPSRTDWSVVKAVKANVY